MQRVWADSPHEIVVEGFFETPRWNWRWLLSAIGGIAVGIRSSVDEQFGRASVDSRNAVFSGRARNGGRWAVGHVKDIGKVVLREVGADVGLWDEKYLHSAIEYVSNSTKNVA